MTYLIESPGMDPKKMSVKDLIITVMTTDWPLAQRKLFNLLKKRYGLGVSYQAVHKALQELVKKNIVAKNDKEYSLNLDWVKELQEFTGKLEESYITKTPLAERKWKENMQTFVFDNLFNMDKFLIAQFTELLTDEERIDLPCYSHWEFSWWPLFFSRQEYRGLAALKNPSRIYISIRDSSDVAKLCANMYTKLGVKIKVGMDLENNFDYIILGDSVIQMYWPEQLKKDVKKVFKGVKDLAQLDMHALVQIFERKEKINVVVLKNLQIARVFSKKVHAMF